ncbi:MAG: hypothetical protein QOE70_3838 [Chthoniobacter sp.]|jgi:DNA-binding NarL/FixJ family response regulator|nr:hypothetical protein [Chthoniobacter sp.]
MSSSGNAAQIKVVLVEDHPMFRERLAQLIRKDLDMIVCGEAENIQQAMQLIRSCQPDIAIVDISLPGSSGLELIKDLKAQGLPVPVLVLSMHEESLYAERVLRAGARGYITKNEAAAQVIEAIRRVLAGDIYVSERVTSKILQRISHIGSRVEKSGMDLLTDRELEVFQMVGHGRNTREIAQQLHLGDSTVDTYRARIKEKLQIRNAAELYQRAAQWVKEQGM